MIPRSDQDEEWILEDKEAIIKEGEVRTFGVQIKRWIEIDLKKVGQSQEVKAQSWNLLETNCIKINLRRWSKVSHFVETVI